jgi:hypothetical protein
MNDCLYRIAVAVCDKSIVRGDIMTSPTSIATHLGSAILISAMVLVVVRRTQQLARARAAVARRRAARRLG